MTVKKNPDDLKAWDSLVSSICREDPAISRKTLEIIRNMFPGNSRFVEISCDVELKVGNVQSAEQVCK